MVTEGAAGVAKLGGQSAGNNLEINIGEIHLSEMS